MKNLAILALAAVVLSLGSLSLAADVDDAVPCSGCPGVHQGAHTTTQSVTPSSSKVDNFYGP